MDDFSVLLLLNNSSISLDDKELTFDAVAWVKCMAGHMNKLSKKPITSAMILKNTSP